MQFFHPHLFDFSEDHHPHSQVLFVVAAVADNLYISEQFQYLIVVFQDQVNIAEPIV